MSLNEQPTRRSATSIGYNISLSDGNQLHLSADAPLRPWLDKFAAIMKLNKTSFNGNPKLTYSLNSNPTLSQSHSELQNTPTNSDWDFSEFNTLCVWLHKETSDMICKPRLLNESRPEEDRSALEFISMCDALFPIYRQSIWRGGLPFHAALVEKEGAGVLLAGTGDTGKSTCCRRLPDDWRPLCDDETLVVLDDERRYRVHPFPTWSDYLSWSDYLYRGTDKTWDIQYSVPLRGVFFLEQSATDETTALGQGEAVALVNRSVTQVCKKFCRTANMAFQRNLRKQIFNNACEFSKRVPAFRLRVSLNGRFWEKIEQALGW